MKVAKKILFLLCLLLGNIILTLLLWAVSPENIYRAMGHHKSEEVLTETPPTRIHISQGVSRSRCSTKATARGPRQKVVSFSYFGPRLARDYFPGVPANAEALPIFYPDWTMRVYADSTEELSWSALQKLEAQVPVLDVCDVSNLPVIGNVRDSQGKAWRFLPLVDPLVEMFISRDLDSRPSKREAAAVADWIAANVSFHIMRDNIFHCLPMLGGMWGARKDLEPFYVTTAAVNLVKVMRRGITDNDQLILKKLIFPALTGRVIQHDSFFCQTSKWKTVTGGMRPFPTKRINGSYNFVGSVINMDEKPMLQECPIECRPSNHKDWSTC